jgi:hypothetical protein
MRRFMKWSMAMLGALLLSSCATQGALEGWTTLLDGERGLENWNRTGDGNWRAAQGAIQIDGKTNKGAAFLYSNSGTLRFRKVLIRPL